MLSGKLGVEDATREIVREKVSHRIGDLLENIDILSREVERHSGRRVLIIVEDLDKADLGTAKRLFYEHARSLAAPEVTVIYTFPTAKENGMSEVGQIIADLARLATDLGEDAFAVAWRQAFDGQDPPPEVMREVREAAQAASVSDPEEPA